MRVLAIHRYYWPDTSPYGSILRAIVARWASDGHEVEVLSSQPSYKGDSGNQKRPKVEVLDGVRVRRLRLPREIGRPLVRLANIGLLFLAVLWQAITRGRFDVIMASTTPPIFAGMAGRWAAKLTGAKFIYHCMDLHPEIGRISGEFRNPFLFSILRGIDSRNCRSASRVVVLSRDMAQTVRERPSGEQASVKVINNFHLPDCSAFQETATPAELAKAQGTFRILFAGNIGRFQGLGAVIDAMARLRHREDVECVFLGEGAAKADLVEQAESMHGQQVKFFPHQPLEVARSVIQTADLCLVTLTPSIYKYAFPSKTMTYLGEGRPLLVSVETHSELAEFVTQEEVGVVVPPDSPERLASTVAELADNPEKLERMKNRARSAGQAHFEQERVLDRWSELVREVGKGK